MEQFSWDKEAFRKDLTRFLCEHFGLGTLSPDTPMPEIRKRAEFVGSLLGRSMAVCLHDGPVGADIAMRIRGCEQEGKELILNVMAKLCRPGGELREIWNKRVAAEDVEQLNSLD